MPEETPDRPGSPPGKSQLPDSIPECRINLESANVLTPEELEAITKFRHAANCIAAAMISLKDGILLKREIKPEDTESRLLGYWGTCPELVLTYARLNVLIRKETEKMIFAAGPDVLLPYYMRLSALPISPPGHGAPAVLATL